MPKKVLDYGNPPLEILLSITEPTNIYIHSKKTDSGKPSAAILHPIEDVKKELTDWMNAKNITAINTVDLKRENVSVYNKLVSWSYALDKSTGAGRAIHELGLRTVNDLRDLDENRNELLNSYTEKILKLFPEEYIMDFFLSGKSKKERTEYVLNARPELRTAYEGRKWRAKQFGISISAIIDEAYPAVAEKTGLLPSQILRFEPFSEKTISDMVLKMYYEGEDIRTQALDQTRAGRNLLYFISFTNNRPNIPAKKGRTMITDDNNHTQYISSSHGREVLKYFEQRFVKNSSVLEQYLLNDQGSRADLAILTENEFSLFLNILAKHDPYMENFPELSGRIKGPITFVYNPNQNVYRRVMHENRRVADGRFNAGGESYLVELKNTEYSTPQKFLESLSKYDDITQWFDGSHIDNKILFINKSINGAARKIPPEWTIIRGSEFSVLYKRALELWHSKEPQLNNFSPMAEIDSMMRSHELLHDKSHITIRMGNRALRGMIKRLEAKLFDYLDSPDMFHSYLKYDFEYSMSLNDLGIYPEGFVKHMSKNTLFFDLETYGFRNLGNPIISATVGERQNDDFICTTYFARTPLEEKRLLENLVGRIDSSDSIITYNGSTFDLPFIEERCLANLIDYICHKKHTDLYTSYYKKVSASEKSPRATVKSFERNELKIDRRGDVASSRIPGLYLDYLLGADGAEMMHVIAHNFLDVFTMPFIQLHSQGYRFETSPKDVSLRNFRHLFKNVDVY